MLARAVNRPGAGHYYQTVDTAGRTAAADPHALVMLLFDELVVSLDAMIGAERHGRRADYVARQGRALNILHGLESSLDHRAGAGLANDLAAVYGRARALILQASRTREIGHVAVARTMMAALADAWATIG